MSVLHPLKLTICDDGKGFSPDCVTRIGLRSMRERAEKVGDFFRMNSAAEGGAQVTVHLPITLSSFSVFFAKE